MEVLQQLQPLQHRRHLLPNTVDTSSPAPSTPAPWCSSPNSQPTKYMPSIVLTFLHIMISSLLKEGEARVEGTLHKGYAPPSFAHNLELIFVQDNRRSASLSMKTKIVSTSERAARLRSLEPPTLLWWATAFPMREWSGGRKISNNTFESLLRHAPQQIAQFPSLRAVLWEDMELLKQKHTSCEMLQDFLSAILHGKAIPTAIRALSQQGRYISLTGAQYDCLPKLPDLLRSGIECSRKYQEEANNRTSISTTLEIFLPLNPDEDEACAIVRIGTREAWNIMQELKIVEEEPSSC